MDKNREALTEQAAQKSAGDGVSFNCIEHPHTCCVTVDDISEDSIETVEFDIPVDLTDQEIQKLRHKIDWTAEWSYVNFARAVIAADREKNK